MSLVTPWRLATIVRLMMICLIELTNRVEGCNMKTKEVGVCLHVYLERDFLSMERIVYPKKNAQWREIYSYRQAPPKLPELEEVLTNSTRVGKRSNLERTGRHKHHLTKEGRSWRRLKRTSLQDNYVREGSSRGPLDNHVEDDSKRRLSGASPPENYAIFESYDGRYGWVEGPELEDYCRRLGGVIACFEEVLINCDNGYDFFRYRHLLYSLELVHNYLCHTPDDRLKKFLPFLQVIDCAERARLKEKSCHRPNVTENVWNQILRMEIGPELCNSLNTQRACLLENRYVKNECGGSGGDTKEDLYRNVSAIFLATWCRLPLPPSLLPYIGSTSSHHEPLSLLIITTTLCYLCIWRLLNLRC